MASINRLAIRGVRSFSPVDEEQAVEFFFPCTIIVGANGCGKTTIIESLRYAMAGAFPPGNKSGQAFVHDPRSIGSQIVKAQVKLRFTSKANKSMVVIRSMELTQKKTTLSFKQLDGALRTLDTDTNKIVSLSHKCGELDRQLPVLLGVSKPILEHVLFCHQEDASWPLQEGAVLKKRFDDIFDSTRYTKAIDVFRKTEKELNAKVKDLKAELAGFSSHRHAANGFKKELGRHNESLEEVEEAKKRLAAEIQEAEEVKAKAVTIIDEMEALHDRIVNTDSAYTNKLEIVGKQKKMLEKDLTGEHSAADLQKMLREYDHEVASHSEELERLQNEDKDLSHQIQKLNGEERSLVTQKSRLEAALEQQSVRCKERFSKMEHMQQTFGLELNLTSSQGAEASMDGSFAGSQGTHLTSGAASVTDVGEKITQDDMDNFFQVVDRKEKELKEAFQEAKTSHQAEEDKLVAALSELEGKRKTVQAERQKILEQREQATQEQRELIRDMEKHGRVRKADIEDHRRQAQRLADERNTANSDPRRTQIPVEIRSLEEKIDAAKRKIEDDRLVLDSLRHCSENQHQITMLKEQCNKDTEAFLEAYQEQSYSLQKHNLKPNRDLPNAEDDVEGHELVSFVEEIMDNVRSKQQTIKKDLSKAVEEETGAQQAFNNRSAFVASQKATLASVVTRLENLENGSLAQMKKCIDNIRHFETKRKQEPPSREAPPQEFLSYLENRLTDIEEDAPLDIAGAAKKVFKKLGRMARVVDSSAAGFCIKCPCCTREMNKAETAVFKEKMSELKKDPTFSESNNEETEEYQRMKGSYEKFSRQLQPMVGDLRDAEQLRKDKAQLEVEVEQINDELSTLKSNLDKCREQVKTVQEEEEEIRSLAEACRRWNGDVSRIHEKRMQIGQKQQDLTLDVTSDTRDLRTVEREIADAMEEKDSHMNKINRLNKEMTSLNNRIASLSTSASNMDKVVREKEAKFAATEKKETRKSELAKLLSKIQEDDTKLSEQLAPLKRKIETKSREKDRARALKESEVSEHQNTLIEFQGEIKELRRVSKVIDDFLASEQPKEFDRVATHISQAQGKMKEKQEDQKKLKVELEKLRDAAQDHERHKKMIRDNLEIIETEKETKKMLQTVEDLRQQLSEIEGGETARDEEEKANAKIDKKSNELARQEGQYIQIVEAIRSLNRKLKSEEYKNVDEEFRVTNIKYNTTQMAADDLKKYWTAVDKALLKFHAVKIAEINKIVQELWLLTYKGEDIAGIKIVSGQEPGSRSTRSYNYRVVMTKGNSELDMRGRCSAGQRVLASIVIRLALAETFGVSCGCIALDEPTVNLDYPNKKGLAVALAQIIASRSQQSNFQLILITHDEEFVSMVKTEMSMLTGFSMPEKYFQVRRERAPDGKFYSKIDAKDWSELV